MNDRELNEVLKRAAVPEQGADYWERFPARITAETDRRKQESGAERSQPGTPREAASVSNHWSWASVVRSLSGKPAFALGMATACVVLGCVLGFWKGHRSPVNEPQLAEVRKYFREIEALFPNQLQAIVFDQQGTHLVLAQEPNLPASPPLYLKVSGPKGCQRFVTFSGQQIHLNGEVCDVLADHEGNVLLVGRQLLWSGSRAVARSGPYQIEARALETAL